MISRRAVLQGMGVSLALPWMESFGLQDRPPMRAAFFYLPNGVALPSWNVDATLAPVGNDVLRITGLAHDKARANGDGPGDHARAAATFLTGCQARKTEGRELRAGISVDQLAAKHARTKLPSIELGCEAGALSGNCDSGYSCAYSSSISWRSEGQPAGKIVKPRHVFQRLFGDPDAPASAEERARRAAENASVLDLVREDARSLRARVGRADAAKLDEYLEATRDVEKRIQSAERAPEISLPPGVPEYRAHVKIMIDLLVLAFRSDATRIATFMFANEGSERTYPFLGAREGHHTLSHHGGAQEKLDRIAKIDRFHVEQFAYFLGELRKGGLLDRTLAVFGSGIADGNAHNHEDLPVLLAGGGIKPGRELRAPSETPMCNLFLSLLDRLDIRVPRFGDSTGRLEGL